MTESLCNIGRDENIRSKIFLPLHGWKCYKLFKTKVINDVQKQRITFVPVSWVRLQLAITIYPVYIWKVEVSCQYDTR